MDMRTSVILTGLEHTPVSFVQKQTHFSKLELNITGVNFLVYPFLIFDFKMWRYKNRKQRVVFQIQNSDEKNFQRFWVKQKN